MSSYAIGAVAESLTKEGKVSASILVLGLGEVGRPLLEVLGQRHSVIGIDIEPVQFTGECEVMHVCYWYKKDDFVRHTIAYIKKYGPRLTVINSTVAPGTTRTIYEATGVPIVHSPVRGKHSRMREELLRYVKFIGGIRQEWSARAAEHFQSLGMKTKILSSPEATELAKLTETTYFGLMIAWAQEVERYCDDLLLSYDEVVSFYEGIGFFPPVKYFPGEIGGHCVMPNIGILRGVFESDILEAIDRSNALKMERDALGTGRQRR